jgi:very-short-patch-repair endonuclease
MSRVKLHPDSSEAWSLAARQHGVVTRKQLLALGMSEEAVEHRIHRGRLHRLRRGVYVVGRPAVSRAGQLMAAALSCGSRARISHYGAGWLWGISTWEERIDVVVPNGVFRRRPGIQVHRRLDLDSEEKRRVHGIPVTDPVNTIVDLASSMSDARLERTIRETDRLGLADPESLREALDEMPSRPGTGRLRGVLEAASFSLTDSELERRFLRLVRRGGLSLPKTQVQLNGYRVDFYWPDLGLVVETDGLIYHRTPSQQKRDRLRDQAHTAAGLTTLRFTAHQVRFEPNQTLATLRASMQHLRGHSPGNAASSG